MAIQPIEKKKLLSRRKKSFLWFLIFFFYLSTLGAFIRHTSKAFDDWQVGDWLINYQGGFVRRGLIGQILFLLPFDLTISTTVVQIILFTAFFFLMAVMFVQTQPSPVWFMVFFSPAVLFFGRTNIHSIARKELIIFVALAILVVGYQKSLRWTTPLSFILFFIAVFSHEALALTLPTFCYLIWLEYKKNTFSRKKALTYISFFSVSAVTALAMSAAHIGSDDQMKKICESWRSRGINSCGGSLAWLSRSTSEAIEGVGSLYPSYLLYIPLFILAFTPFFLIKFFPKYWQITTVVLVCLAPLFVVGEDYGRWINIALTSLVLVAFSVKDTLSKEYQIHWMVAIIFCFLWGVGDWQIPMNQGILYQFFPFFN